MSNECLNTMWCFMIYILWCLFFQGRFKINLSGTGFKVAEDTSWISQGNYAVANVQKSQVLATCHICTQGWLQKKILSLNFFPCRREEGVWEQTQAPPLPVPTRPITYSQSQSTSMGKGTSFLVLVKKQCQSYDIVKGSLAVCSPGRNFWKIAP